MLQSEMASSVKLGSVRRKPAKATEADEKPNALVEAAMAAQRKKLLAALRASGWNLTETAEGLRLHAPSAVIRYIGSLGLTEEYEAAKARGDVKQGRPKG